MCKVLPGPNILSAYGYSPCGQGRAMPGCCGAKGRLRSEGAGAWEAVMLLCFPPKQNLVLFLPNHARKPTSSSLQPRGICTNPAS